MFDADSFDTASFDAESFEFGLVVAIIAAALIFSATQVVTRIESIYVHTDPAAP